MARRKVTPGAIDEIPAPPVVSDDAPEVRETKPAVVAPARLDVRMSGSAESVRRELMGGKEGVAEKTKPADAPKEFAELLKNPRYVVKVKRVRPKMYNGERTNVEVWSSELPLPWADIQNEVTETAGGGTYRVAVIDPESGATIDAKTFEVEGEPLLQSPKLTPEEEMMLGRTPEKSSAELSEDALERKARLTAKQIEVEDLENRLREARAAREQVSGGPRRAAEDTRVAELERRMAEAKHAAELEARDRKHAEEIRALKELIERNQRPQKSEGPSDVSVILQQMQKNQEAADRRFEALQRQMLDDKQTQMLEEIRAIKNKPAQQQSSFLEMAEAMIKMKKLMGWDDGGDDDDEEASDPNDDRPWWERAIDKIGSKFGDQLIERLTSLEEKGQKVDRETFMAEMGKFADQAAADAVAKASRIPAAPPVSALPPPPPQAVPTAPAAVPTQVTTLPPPPPAAVPPPAAPAVATPAAPPAAPGRLTIEQEITLRIGGVLDMIEREVELRPHEYQWAYEGCYKVLPEAVLLKVAASQDPVAMFEAFRYTNISDEKLTQLKNRVAADAALQAWLKMGLDELKEWVEERRKDPRFDPYADEEEDEE